MSRRNRRIDDDARETRALLWMIGALIVFWVAVVFLIVGLAL